MVNKKFFDDLQDEIACELRLMEGEEKEGKENNHHQCPERARGRLGLG
jgi:hypothetical protein